MMKTLSLLLFFSLLLREREYRDFFFSKVEPLNEANSALQHHNKCLPFNKQPHLHVHVKHDDDASRREAKATTTKE